MFLANRKCQDSMMAYLVCGRNMHSARAKNVCKKELQDYMECQSGITSMHDQRRRTLERAREGQGTRSRSTTEKVHGFINFSCEYPLYLCLLYS